MVISGFDFFNSTDLGKVLAEKLPKGLKRVIIDIPIDGVVTIYSQGIDSSVLLDIDVDKIPPEIKFVDAQTKNESKDKD